MSDLPACCIPTEGATLAERLYCAYNAGGDPLTAGLNYQGRPCPVWAELPANVCAKWGVTAAEAIGVAGRLLAGEAPVGSTGGLPFGVAIAAMQAGALVRRAGWNGKGMWLALQVPDAHSKMGHPYVYMSDVAGKLFPWNPNSLDLLASDWEIVTS